LWYSNNMKRKSFSDEGIVYPFFRWFFNKLECLSLLKIITQLVNLCRKDHNGWQPSRRCIDIYVITWILVIGIVSVVVIPCLSLSNNGYIQPAWIQCLLTALMTWRLIDILQRWWHLVFVPPFEAKAPRIIILVFINYIEMVIAFGAIGFLNHYLPYYVSPNEVSIWDAFRASVGILTPLGVTLIPNTWTSGFLFYIEYAVGFFFLVVIINVVLAYLTDAKKN
jgi:hypothetical protein